MSIVIYSVNKQRSELFLSQKTVYITIVESEVLYAKEMSKYTVCLTEHFLNAPYLQFSKYLFVYLTSYCQFLILFPS
jgi:hypothetical protein